MPILMYGLETLPLQKNQLNSLDFVTNRQYEECRASSHMNPLDRFYPWIPYTLKTEEPPALSGKQPRIGDYRWTSRTEHAATPEREMSAVFLLYRALVRVNAYKCAKFQVPSGDMEGIPK